MNEFLMDRIKRSSPYRSIGTEIYVRKSNIEHNGITFQEFKCILNAYVSFWKQLLRDFNSTTKPISMKAESFYIVQHFCTFSLIIEKFSFLIFGIIFKCDKFLTCYMKNNSFHSRQLSLLIVDVFLFCFLFANDQYYESLTVGFYWSCVVHGSGFGYRPENIFHKNYLEFAYNPGKRDPIRVHLHLTTIEPVNFSYHALWDSMNFTWINKLPCNQQFYDFIEQKQTHV